MDAPPPPVDAAPPVDAGPPPAALPRLGALPALYAPLFVAGARLEYRWKWRVDPHDARGRLPPYTTLALACTIEDVADLADGGVVVARTASVTCTRSSTDADDLFAPRVETQWLATADGLREASAADVAEVRERLALPLRVAARPAPASTSSDDVEDEGTGQRYRAWHKVFARGKAWCVESGSTLLYGSLDRACFEPGRGLVSWTVEGRSGPSDETYTLVRRH